MGGGGTKALEAGTILTFDAHGGALPHTMHAPRGGPASMLNPPDPCQVSMSRVSSSLSSSWLRKYPLAHREDTRWHTPSVDGTR